MASKQQMLINYVPGVECRVAVLHDGRLEELHAERMDSASHVGNIYVGKVMNVEASIQAAFVDFGLEENGFLHVTDLHPKYFPDGDDDSTERVGKKTPRRERPPIQACLKRGQEIIVQVLKEGVGTKGPAVTSYLSIPGRFLVMMPDMDNVGVSRRVEDEEQRKAMRAVLDQLDLPENFGFILRTAGMTQTKTALKRDLAYLQRLWKDMERRLKGGDKPRLLYAESDLLTRCLRDVLTTDFQEVVCDDLGALRRANRFLKIVTPRGGAKLLRYAEQTPIFHAFGVESQIKQMHEREVPLPSGGSIIIDEAEALVAIDVNSGRMRGNRDAETTAYKTNCEAVDEVCRQLRLRDLGGLVIVDSIDMRSRKHQREIEQRFRDNLKRDRAHSKVLPISQFGIVEITRQRMRGSHRSVHFADCPHCQGRGHVQRPASVLGEAVRELTWVLSQERVKKAEMVVSPRLASELLSSGRHRLARLERLSGKHVDVRVSETAPIDRVTFYAYDERGADVDLERLPAPRPPEKMDIFEESVPGEADWAHDPAEEAAALVRAENEAEAAIAEQMAESADAGLPMLDLDGGDFAADDEAGGSKKKRRRRRRRGRGGSKGQDGAGDEQVDRDEPAERAPEQRQSDDDEQTGEGGGLKKKRRRRRRGRGGKGRAEGDEAPAQQPQRTAEPKPSAPPVGGGLRGDSWDLEPSALPAAVAASAAPPHHDEADDEAEVDGELEAEVENIEAEPTPEQDGADEENAEPVVETPKKKRRRRRGRRGGKPVDGEAPADAPVPAEAATGGSDE